MIIVNRDPGKSDARPRRSEVRKHFIGFIKATTERLIGVCNNKAQPWVGAKRAESLVII